jgi:hypothetical protein
MRPSRSRVLRRAETNWKALLPWMVMGLGVSIALGLGFSGQQTASQTRDALAARPKPCVRLANGRPSASCDRLAKLLIETCTLRPSLCVETIEQTVKRSDPKVRRELKAAVDRGLTAPVPTPVKPKPKPKARTVPRTPKATTPTPAPPQVTTTGPAAPAPAKPPATTTKPQTTTATRPTPGVTVTPPSIPPVGPVTVPQLPTVSVPLPELPGPVPELPSVDVCVPGVDPDCTTLGLTIPEEGVGAGDIVPTTPTG